MSRTAVVLLAFALSGCPPLPPLLVASSGCRFACRWKVCYNPAGNEIASLHRGLERLCRTVAFKKTSYHFRACLAKLVFCVPRPVKLPCLRVARRRSDGASRTCPLGLGPERAKNLRTGIKEFCALLGAYPSGAKCFSPAVTLLFSGC